MSASEKLQRLGHELRTRERGEEGFVEPTTLGYTTLAGAAMGLIALGISAWGNLHLIDRETKLDVKAGKATLVDVSTEAPEVCFWEFDTKVEGAKAKLSTETNLNVPDDIPFIGDEVNLTPGIWASSEVNAIVTNKVCSPAGILHAEGNKRTGIYTLSFTPSNDEPTYKLFSDIDSGQPPVNDKPIHVSDSGAAWGASKVAEWVKNRIPTVDDTYAGSRVEAYVEYVADTQAYADGASCLETAYGYAIDGVQQNWVDLWLGAAQAVDPSITEANVRVKMPKLPEQDELQNQYGVIGEFKKAKDVKLTVSSAPPDSCEDGTAINEQPPEE